MSLFPGPYKIGDHDWRITSSNGEFVSIHAFGDDEFNSGVADELCALLNAGWEAKQPKDRPRVVCLCGSTRFADAFAAANERLTIEGKIVLSVGCFRRTAPDGERPPIEEGIKVSLDVLHKRKIDLADEVLVLNVGGYIGNSARSEIDYAKKLGKPIRYLEEMTSPLEARIAADLGPLPDCPKCSICGKDANYGNGTMYRCKDHWPSPEERIARDIGVPMEELIAHATAEAQGEYAGRVDPSLPVCPKCKYVLKPADDDCPFCNGRSAEVTDATFIRKATEQEMMDLCKQPQHEPKSRLLED